MPGSPTMMFVASVLLLLGVCGSPSHAGASGTSSNVVGGSWSLVAQGPGGENSTTIPLLAPTSLSIKANSGGMTTLTRNWTDSSGTSIVVDGVTASSQGTATTGPIVHRDWPYNVFLGVEYDTNHDTGSCTAHTVSGSASSTSLVMAQNCSMVTQQRGGSQAADLLSSATHSATIVMAGTTTYLQYTVSIKQPALAASFWYQPSMSHAAVHLSVSQPQAEEASNAAAATAATSTTSSVPPYNLNVPNVWKLSELSLQETALAIGLQGLANRDAPTLYITYPPQWAYTYTPQVRKYFAKSRNLVFHDLDSVADAVQALRQFIKGYVVWDPTVRESLVVAYTAAGVEDAIVVSPQLVPLAKSLGVPLVANFSGVFRGMTPTQIYTIAKAKYWSRCSKDTIVWAGGVCGDQIQPGIMDWGVAQRTFFTDLSTLPGADGYALADELLGEMAATKPPPQSPLLVMGWHSYCKDYEHTFTRLASIHGGRVHGLNTNPNLSFAHGIKLPPGYVFKNRHSPPPPASFNKVAITLVQTDGLGLGAWTKPGRGTIPYSWEVTLPDLEIQPALLQMFYEQATDKDYFVGALSGPGYMYPKAVPPALLPARLGLAQRMMKVLDLNHFIVFDASACVGAHTVTGDTWLTPDVVSTYFEAMNETVGFLNGYGPTFTFQHTVEAARNRSLLSFDYYLDPSRTVAEAVADIEALATANAVRPYFLAIHVTKVEQIIAALDPALYEVLPVDTWFELANRQPTWWEHYS